MFRTSKILNRSCRVAKCSSLASHPVLCVDGRHAISVNFSSATRLISIATDNDKNVYRSQTTKTKRPLRPINNGRNV